MFKGKTSAFWTEFNFIANNEIIKIIFLDFDFESCENFFSIFLALGVKLAEKWVKKWRAEFVCLKNSENAGFTSSIMIKLSKKCFNLLYIW